MQRNDVFTKIAQQHLGIETLETRNRDSLDFHDVSVWGVKAALEAAYAAGQLATDKIRQKRIANGGSYLAAFEAKYQDIVDFFGEPSEGDQYKTEAEWRVLMPKGQILKIYNYKTRQNTISRFWMYFIACSFSTRNYRRKTRSQPLFFNFG